MNPKKRLRNEETQIDVNFHQDVNHSSQFQGLYLTKNLERNAFNILFWNKKT